MNLILIGMMGCGKSTCAALLAGQLGRQWVDTDQLIVRRAGCSIPEIFARDGEEGFRRLEAQIIGEVCRGDDLIIATGGGAVLRPENVAALRSSGTVVWLNRPAGQIFDGESMQGRPLAQQGRQAFLDRFAQREPLYRAAAHIIIEDFSSPQATAAQILRLWQSSRS